jgi:hypothetical protein
MGGLPSFEGGKAGLGGGSVGPLCDWEKMPFEGVLDLGRFGVVDLVGDLARLALVFVATFSG